MSLRGLLNPAHPATRSITRSHRTSRAGPHEEGRLSPKQLSDFTKKHLSLVGYHVRELAKHGAVELVGTRPRRGAVEHFYKATPLVDEVAWGRAALGLESEAAWRPR